MMDELDAQLIEQLKEGLAAQGLPTAFGDESVEAEVPEVPEAPETAPQEDDLEGVLESDFFRAMNAFRAARASGDPERIAASEEAWRQVVRGELAGE